MPALRYLVNEGLHRLVWLPIIVLAVMGSPALAGEDDLGIPQGPGSEEAYYTCSACHSFLLVAQQGLDKAGWEEVLTWMVEEQEMEPLEPMDYQLILEYLAKYYGRDHLANQLQKDSKKE